MLIEYYSNNSGGREWLDVKDWTNLQKAGWRIETFDGPWDGVEKTNVTSGPAYAYKEFDSIEDAMKDWEEATGMDAHTIGCPCCGPPHRFTEEEDVD